MLDETARAMSALGAPRWSLFFLMLCPSGPVRAWLGVGPYEVDADDVDTEGGTYLGLGLVGDIPALNQLVGGVAERVQFVLSGVDEAILALADEDADEVRHAPVHVGLVFFDEDWQAAAPIAWLWEGTADSPSIDEAGDTDGRSVRRVILSVGSAFVDRTRPPLAFYTPAEQKRRSATDTFCDRVPAYSIESTIQWPAAPR